MKKLVILGSTGSIGTQALEIVASSEELQVVGLAAGTSWEQLLGQAHQHGVPTVALAGADAAERARSAWDGRVLAGEEGVRELIAAADADLVLNGTVGAAGLGPTVFALGEGIDVALANKESLVIGGELTTALAEATGARLIPVDSEHSALFQLIGAEQPGTVERLVLTASGGALLGRSDLSRGCGCAAGAARAAGSAAPPIGVAGRSPPSSAGRSTEHGGSRQRVVWMAARTSSPGTKRRAAAPKSTSAGWRRYELALRIPRLLGADHPARGRPLLRRQGDRDAGGGLLPLFPADPFLNQTGRDRVWGQSDPPRGPRENQRDESGGEASSGSRASGLLPPAGVEADRRDRCRPGGEHRPRLRAPFLRRLPLSRSRQQDRLGESRLTRSCVDAQARRPAPVRPRPEAFWCQRGKAARPVRAHDLCPQMRREDFDERLPGQHARRVGDREGGRTPDWHRLSGLRPDQQANSCGHRICRRGCSRERRWSRIVCLGQNVAGWLWHRPRLLPHLRIRTAQTDLRGRRYQRRGTPGGWLRRLPVPSAACPGELLAGVDQLAADPAS